MEKGIQSEMHKLDFPNKLAKLRIILNNGMYARVRTGEYLSSKCKINKGMREGDAIYLCCLMYCWKLQLEDLK
jgi:hypothetical protein